LLSETTGVGNLGRLPKLTVTINGAVLGFPAALTAGHFCKASMTDGNPVLCF